MKILFILRSPAFLRHYDAVIQLLTEKGHTVVLGVNKKLEWKRARLESFAETCSGVVIAGVVPQRKDVWRHVSSGLRGMIDFVRFLHPRFAQTLALRARMKEKGLPKPFRFLGGISTLSEFWVKHILHFLYLLEKAIPSCPQIEKFIQSHHPHILLVSPLVDTASRQVDWVKSARAVGIRTGVCIASWDNLTNKGLMRVQPDAVFVWNERQKSEAVELHGVPAGKIMVTGAQSFDRWFQRRPSMTREAFCRKIDLPAEKPFVLFVGSSNFIAAPEAEVSFVRGWIEALRESEDSAIRELGIMIRPHPYNARHWEELDLSGFTNVILWPRRGANPVDEQDRADYFDSLFFSTAVIGINTSAMIEAAIVGRPVLTIQTPEFTHAQEGTLHFHYLLPENGGFLQVAADFPEHLAQLSLALQEGEVEQERRQRFVESFVRPHGLTTPCTPLLVEAIEQLGREKSAPPERMPFWLFPVRALLWCVGRMGVRKKGGEMHKVRNFAHAAPKHFRRKRKKKPK